MDSLKYRRHHVALAVDGMVMTFRCPAGHVYRKDFAKLPLPKRPSAWWLKRMLSYWGEANGGCTVTKGRHAQCRREEVR